MKKSIIAASASAAALAAMPILGAFAATGNSFTDTLTVSVEGGCTIENADTAAQTNPADPGTYVDREFENTIAAGTVGYLNADDSGAVDTPSALAPAFTVACNAGTSGEGAVASWIINVDANDLESGNHTITPGSTFTGDTSHYGIQSNATYAQGVSITDPYASYTYVSDSDTFLAAANGVAVTFNPSYKVYVSPSQEVGDYEGDVVYTITLPQEP